MSDPYTIRLELLKLSFQILENDYNQRSIKRDNEFFAEKDRIPDQRHEYKLIEPITTDQVIAEAKILNEFISHK